VQTFCYKWYAYSFGSCITSESLPFCCRWKNVTDTFQKEGKSYWKFTEENDINWCRACWDVSPTCASRHDKTKSECDTSPVEFWLWVTANWRCILTDICHRLLSMNYGHWQCDLELDAGKYRLRNDLYCVGWGVKLYSLTQQAWFLKGKSCI